MSDLSDGGVPALVPARMVNEFAYCPRLFFLEWVEARFADNADTVDGRYQHRVVDRAGGRVPAPDPESGEAPDLRSARQVQLSSPTLGLVGKIDLLELADGGVSPVDYKRGNPPDNDERAWEPERIQLCVLGLLLRDAGYRCKSGVLYFAEVRRRVEVIFDNVLIERTMALLADLREVAARDVPPPPLLDSPKCPRCSLVGICLPDEINYLLARQTSPVRRLVPHDDQARPVYVREPGATVGIREGRLEVTRKPRNQKGEEPTKSETLASVRLIDVSQLCVFGNVQVTTQALRELWARDAPVLWFSGGGWLTGVGTGMPSKHVHLRRSQMVVAGQGGLAVTRAMVEGKIRNSRTLLRRNGRPAPRPTLESLATMVVAAASATSVSQLLGIEGAAARVYFEAFPSMLRPELSLPGDFFTFDGRNRRPPTDAVNCLLSFLYGLLVKDLVATLLGVGFDPYLGIYHRPRFGRPALALDLAEEFRPLVGDSVVINLINNGEVRPSDFTVRGSGVALTPNGRKTVIASYERRVEVEVTHPIFGYRISYRRLFDVQARLLGAHFLGEVPKYTAFTTR